MAVSPVCHAELSRAATRVYLSKEYEFDWSLSCVRVSDVLMMDDGSNISGF